MKGTLKPVLFALFFASGFCGLLYQVVWLRLCFAHFGVIAPVLSVLVSVFMLGLFAGSWAGGKAARGLSARLGVSSAWLYAAAEAAIGVGAFAVPGLLDRGDAWLLGSGAADSAGYLLRSALVIAAAVFPWCAAMGATFPFMMAFVRERDRGQGESFSYLYLANTVGAMVGTLVTALVLIESLGFRHTLWLAGATNFAIASAALVLGAGRSAPAAAGTEPAPKAGARAASARLAADDAAVLFVTGFTAMAMEVVWTRGFTPVLRTEVYSFATLLTTYLLATWLGSYVYRRHLSRGTVLDTTRLIAWLGLAALLPLALNDPRLRLKAGGALFSIAPFCGLLGYLTPAVIDRASSGEADVAGAAYAVNVLGCILGPLFASYALLPTIGVKWSLMALAVPYAALFVSRLTAAERRSALPRLGAALALVALVGAASRTYEDQVQGFRGDNGEVRRDHTATVISYGEGMEKRLLVNGIGITHLTTVTKVMAHFPLALLPRKPASALVICLGMGTTYRALMSWGIDVTAVELVPSVKDALPYYFPDARDLVTKPTSHIIVDDGRRWLRRTSETYDLVTLDPPPPVEAAGSSLLYSEGFYAAVKERLKPGGILQQWLPGAEPRIRQAVARSLSGSFPYVRVYRAYEGDGYHFLASLEPIPEATAAQLASRLPPAARADMVEWMEGPRRDVKTFFEAILSQRVELSEVMGSGDDRITDDRPFNEYFVLRRNLPKLRRLLTGAP